MRYSLSIISPAEGRSSALSLAPSCACPHTFITVRMHYFNSVWTSHGCFQKPPGSPGLTRSGVTRKPAEISIIILRLTLFLPPVFPFLLSFIHLTLIGYSPRRRAHGSWPRHSSVPKEGRSCSAWQPQGASEWPQPHLSSPLSSTNLSLLALFADRILQGTKRITIGFPKPILSLELMVEGKESLLFIWECSGF